MVPKINPAEWSFVGNKFWNRGTGGLRGKYMELDPSGGPLLPSWKWKDEGAVVIAPKNITDFIAERYYPRHFNSSSRQIYAHRTLQAFVNGIPSRSIGDLLRAIEKDIESTFPGFKRHVEQLERQPNDAKVRVALMEILEAISVWFACMEHLNNLHVKDKEEVDRLNYMHKLKEELHNCLRYAASALVGAVRPERRVLYCKGAVKVMANWLEERKEQKRARRVRFADKVEYHIYSSY